MLNNIEVSYSGVGIDSFTHGTHESYACLGPYIPSWMLGAASWHPSVIGHSMRGGRLCLYSYTLYPSSSCLLLVTSIQRGFDIVNVRVLLSNATTNTTRCVGSNITVLLLRI